MSIIHFPVSIFQFQVSSFYFPVSIFDFRISVFAPMDNLVIETPEQIPLEFPLAGIGSRFLALALDTGLQIIAWAILGGSAYAVGLRGLHQPVRGVWMTALIVFLLFLLQSGYFAIFEALWNGQTPGKRLMNLRVIEESGRPITVYEAVARNLLRIIDSIPVLYGVGIISALVSAKSKRLGDYVAGTVVVHEKAPVLDGGLRWETAASSHGARFDVSRLTPGEFQLVEAFLLRRKELAESVRRDAARKIVERLSPRLALTAEDAQDPEKLLETLALAYRARARYGSPASAARP
ncbi:MAG: RDD family protein [Terriglobia bacterium]